MQLCAPQAGGMQAKSSPASLAQQVALANVPGNLASIVLAQLPGFCPTWDDARGLGSSSSCPYASGLARPSAAETSWQKLVKECFIHCGVSSVVSSLDFLFQKHCWSLKWSSIVFSLISTLFVLSLLAVLIDTID